MKGLIKAELAICLVLLLFTGNKALAAENVVTSGKKTQINVNAPADGDYYLGIEYESLKDNILATSISLSVNGEMQSPEFEHLFFDDIWQTGEKEYDRYGNESIAMPVKVKEKRVTYLKSTSFYTNSPLTVHLKKGGNTLEFEANEGSICITDIFVSEETVKPESLGAEPLGSGYVEIEAEDFVRRNSPNIRTLASFDPSVTPYDPAIKLQNVIDEDSFKIAGTYVEYDFSVKEEGYYYMGFDYMQSTKSNFTCYRNIYIDGVIPEAGCENVAFPYNGKYSIKNLESPVYLTKGEHTLRLEVAIEPYGTAIKQLNELVAGINDLALSVNKITGGNTNKYRDFDLSEYGMDIEGTLLSWADEIEGIYESVAALDSFGKKNGEIKLLDAAAVSLRELAKEPNKLPQNIDTFSYGDSSVRQYLTNVAENLSYGNISFDRIFFYQKDAKVTKDAGFFKKMMLSLKHFLASFTRDDYAPGYDKGETLEIWVNRPRQYLEIIQRMADSDFTEKTGIKVNLSIVPDQQKLILSNASGKAPDGAIGIASSYVYDLALRGALVDLRQFDDFKEVGREFAPGMLIPAVCDEGVYAIPETFNFYVLFYRTDVFEKLGLSVPDNMQEVRTLLPELARMGLGFNTHVANMQTKTFAATAPFIFQAGGDIFGEDTTRVNLESEEVINGLKTLCENFTIYDMDYEILNFFQSFRDGRTPIGVSNYVTYNLLINAAPELNGCWDIALYPGELKEDGSVDRTTSGTAEMCLAFSSSDKQKEAWEFLKWWMSDEVQTEFSFTLQTTLGNEYMWNSANLKAIESAPWAEDDKKVILEQIGFTSEMPRVPGSYMIERELGNVLVNVVTANENIRTAIDNAQKRINSELLRKLEEFGYIDSDGNELKKLVVPDLNLIKEWLK